MSVIKLLVIAAFMVVLGCSSDVDHRTKIYLPFYENCRDDLTRFVRHLGQTEPAIKTETMFPYKTSVDGDIYNGLVKLEFSSSQFEAIEPSINRFLYDCGPNASITMTTNSLDEFSIRKSIAMATHLDSYEGEFMVEIVENEAAIYFSQER